MILQDIIRSNRDWYREATHKRQDYNLNGLFNNGNSAWMLDPHVELEFNVHFDDDAILKVHLGQDFINGLFDREFLNRPEKLDGSTANKLKVKYFHQLNPHQRLVYRLIQLGSHHLGYLMPIQDLDYAVL